MEALPEKKMVMGFLLLAVFFISDVRGWTGEIHGRVVCDVCGDSSIGPEDHVLEGSFLSLYMYICIYMYLISSIFPFSNVFWKFICWVFVFDLYFFYFYFSPIMVGDCDHYENFEPGFFLPLVVIFCELVIILIIPTKNSSLVSLFISFFMSVVILLWHDFAQTLDLKNLLKKKKKWTWFVIMILGSLWSMNYNYLPTKDIKIQFYDGFTYIGWLDL